MVKNHRAARWGTVAGLAVVAMTVAALFAVNLAGVRPPASLTPFRVDIPPMRLAQKDKASALALEQSFARIGYRLDGVVSGKVPVPPVFLDAVPPDMDQLAPIDRKKRVFMRLVLPLVLRANAEIAYDRERVIAFRERVGSGLPLAPAEARWLANLADRYGVPADDFDALLERVDVIPNALAMAQAIEESGWGTSRFVQIGKNLYGHTTSSRDGIAPLNGDGWRMRRFETLLDSVRAYMHNLNTHRAYAEFRRRRAAARAEGREPDAAVLAETLIAYSERRQAYIRRLKRIIRGNRLDRFETARLQPVHQVMTLTADASF